MMDSIDTKELAYLVGVSFGDGYLFRGKYEDNRCSKGYYWKYTFGLTTKSRKFAERFRDCFKDSFNRELPINIYHNKKYNRNYWEVKTQRKKDFEVMFELVSERKVKKLTNSKKVEILRGIFDSEGSITVSSKGLLLRMGCNKGEGLIGKLLDDLEVPFSTYRYQKGILNYHLWSSRARMLHNLFGEFTIEGDEQKYQTYFQNKEYKGWTNEEEEKLKELYKKPLLPREVAKKIGRTKTAILTKVQRLGIERPSEIKFQIDSKSHKSEKIDRKVPKMKELRRKGLSYRKIAERVGCNPQTVWNRLN